MQRTKLYAELVAVSIGWWLSGAVMAQAPKGSGTDQQFLRQAASDGLAEVQLGTMASTQAVSLEVQQFGRRMVTDHTKANQELMALAQAKHIGSDSPGAHADCPVCRHPQLGLRWRRVWTGSVAFILRRGDITVSKAVGPLISNELAQLITSNASTTRWSSVFPVWCARRCHSRRNWPTISVPSHCSFVTTT